MQPYANLLRQFCPSPLVPRGLSTRVMRSDGARLHQSCTSRPMSLSEGASGGKTSPRTVLPRTRGKAYLTFNLYPISYMGTVTPSTASRPPLQLHGHRHTTSKQSKIGFSGFYKTGLDMNFSNAVCKLKPGLIVYYW